MSNEQPHSGSRWEPSPATPADEATDDRAGTPTEQAGAAHHDGTGADQQTAAAQAGPADAADGRTATDASDTSDDAATAHSATPPPPPAPGPWPPFFPSAALGATPKPRRNRRRAGLLAAAAAGLLAVGGAGGYAVGRAAAPDAPPVGLTGAAGGYGHHRGPLGGGDGGFDRDGGATGGGAGSTGTST
jgi:hypothetical protein